MPEVDGKSGIDTIYRSSGEPSIYPEALDGFMDGLEREEFLGKLVTDPAYWESKISYAQEKLRDAEIARKGVSMIASDALAFREEDPEAFAELPSEQHEVLDQLADKVLE